MVPRLSHKDKRTRRDFCWRMRSDRSRVFKPDDPKPSKVRTKCRAIVSVVNELFIKKRFTDCFMHNTSFFFSDNLFISESNNRR